MPNISITKAAVAEAMKKIMGKKSFDEISVNDILRESGISRKTFYYHFKDKYDLVNWIFYTEAAEGILQCTTLEQWKESSLKFCRYIQENKAFYTSAVNATGQNCFTESLRGMTKIQIEILCAEARGKKTVKKEDVNFMVDFYYHAFIGVFTSWVKNDMKEKPEEIVQKWYCIVDKSVERFVEKFAV